MSEIGGECLLLVVMLRRCLLCYKELDNLLNSEVKPGLFDLFLPGFCTVINYFLSVTRTFLKEYMLWTGWIKILIPGL